MALVILMGGTFISYQLNLLGPMMQMTNAATNQAVEIGKEKLREFLQNNEMARQALSMTQDSSGDGIDLEVLNSNGRRRESTWPGDDDL